MTMIAARAGMLALSGLLAVAGWFGGLDASGNFQRVVPGEVFRSGLLPADDFAEVIERHGIRSVLNLRGEKIGAEWYENEVRATSQAGATLLNFKMSAGWPLDEERARELVRLMARAPKPMLIHCEGGADRTGLAAALYLAAVEGVPVEIAGRQLSPRYGHVAIEGVTYAWPMTESWRRLSAHLPLQQLASHAD